MDLGCFDMGCIETQRKDTSPEKESSTSSSSASSSDSVMATSKIGKNKAIKESGQSNCSTLNKCASQIRKPPHRKTSPLNWFPRKKVDSYLKRKIKLLQEVDGMNSTLDETLGDSNPHYSRVLKEKIAVREAASKAIEARKAAMIEASWCRILKAARIDDKGAEAQLFEAEKTASVAFEAANAIGLTMYDIPGCPQRYYRIETSATKGGGTHTVSASFETAFEVDKQVAYAVKIALTKLAHCPSIKKADFRELLHKISQNPDSDENTLDFSEFSSECESDTGSEFEVGMPNDGCGSQNYNEKEISGVRQRKYKRRQVSEKFTMANLVEIMLERLKGLQESELASLATIVATCGLNAALAEAEVGKKHDLDFAADHDSDLHAPGRMSISGAGSVRNSGMDGQQPGRMTAETELPSLDKFLVKRLTRLEKEVLEAKNARKTEANTQKLATKSDEERQCSLYNTSSDTGDKPVNHSSMDCQITRTMAETELPSLDKFLVKKLTRLEKEILEAKNARNNEAREVNKQKLDNNDDERLCSLDNTSSEFSSSPVVNHSRKLEREIGEAKENEISSIATNCKKLDSMRDGGVSNGKQDVTELPSLDKFLIKHMSRLEKEVQEAKNRRNFEPLEGGIITDNRKATSFTPYGSSKEKVSCSERENLGKENINLNKNVDGEVDLNEREPFLKTAEELSGESEGDTMQELSLRNHCNIQELHRRNGGNATTNLESLDKILVKHVSMLEREKMEFDPKEEVVMKVKKMDAGEELDKGSDKSLDQILVKHKSRLEREKMAAAAQQSEEVLMKVKKRDTNEELDKGSDKSLDQILVKHKSRLEREKIAAAAQQPEDQIRYSVTRREARQKELQEAWGGLSLGNSMRPHLSRLQRDKAAWLKAEEEERSRVTEKS